MGNRCEPSFTPSPRHPFTRRSRGPTPNVLGLYCGFAQLPKLYVCQAASEEIETVYRIATSKIILENRMFDRGMVVSARDLQGLAATFLSLGLIEAAEDAAQISPRRSALARLMERFQARPVEA